MYWLLASLPAPCLAPAPQVTPASAAETAGSQATYFDLAYGNYLNYYLADPVVSGRSLWGQGTQGHALLPTLSAVHTHAAPVLPQGYCC